MLQIAGAQRAPNSERIRGFMGCGLLSFAFIFRKKKMSFAGNAFGLP